MTQLLELTDVNTAYDDSHVLHDVSMTVAENDTVALLGRNGVGKTTTLKSVIGIQQPFAGTVQWQGTDITREKTHETISRGIGYVPEDRRIFSKLTVEENLTLAMNASAASKADEFDRVFDLFPRLQERRSQHGDSLSGGEQQMLAIARALIGDKELLLLDEPTEGLAPKIVTDIQDAIDELATELTVVLVEQRYPVAKAVCDRYYILDQGAVVAGGSMAALDDDQELKETHLGVVR
jgi:branched-chain amino acid transport system ATP-binding protein